MGTREICRDVSATGGEWRLIRDNDRWRFEAAGEVAWLPDIRGVHFLRALLAAPDQEFAALDLVAGGAGLRSPDDGPLIDAAAREAYPKRLTELDGAHQRPDRHR